jgi:uroporphyrinogen-III synthase
VREAARSAEYLLLTSSRAVEYLWPDDEMPATPVLAVGVATADTVRQAGGRVAHVGRAGSSALLDEHESAIRGKKIVYPRAAGADPAITLRLTKVARSIFSEAIYATVPVAPPSYELDAVLFASPSSVDGWFLTRNVEGLLVGAIGPTTAATLETRGINPDAQPAIPSAAALAAVLSELVERNLS